MSQRNTSRFPFYSVAPFSSIRFFACCLEKTILFSDGKISIGSFQYNFAIVSQLKVKRFGLRGVRIDRFVVSNI